MVGIYLSAHPLDEYRIILTYVCNTGMAEINDKENLVGKDLLFGGIVTDFREGMTKKGNPCLLYTSHKKHLIFYIKKYILSPSK